MALRARQRRFYKYTFNVYRQVPQTNACEDVVYDSTPVYTDLPALFESTPEADEPTMAGRNKQVNIMTMDHLHIPLQITVSGGGPEVVENVTILDTDYVKMTGAPAGSPDLNEWWAVQGGTQGHATLIGNKQTVYIKKSEKPAGID